MANFWRHDDKNAMSYPRNSSTSDDNQYTLQNFFDRIYVINLNRRPDRELLMMQKMRDRNLDYERITAYDGANLFNCRKTMSKGAWGYLLTWKNILEKAIKENINSFISFDDDIIFHRDFDTQIQNVLRWISKSRQKNDNFSHGGTNWKVICLGASQHVQIEEPTDFFYHPELTDGSFAVAIHSSIFKELLEKVEKVLSYLHILEPKQTRFKNLRKGSENVSDTPNNKFIKLDGPNQMPRRTWTGGWTFSNSPKVPEQIIPRIRSYGLAKGRRRTLKTGNISETSSTTTPPVTVPTVPTVPTVLTVPTVPTVATVQLSDFTDTLPLLQAGASFKLVMDEPEEVLTEAQLILPFDSGPLRRIYKKYKDQCFVIYPNLVISDVRSSTIRGPRDQEQMAQKFRWNLQDYLWSTPVSPYYDLVSIIISCYNSERSIAKSVLAARLQDYPNCEVIVIDDASTDRSPEILMQALEESTYKDPRSGHERPLHSIRVLRNESNMGCYGTRNSGIQAAKGKYITFQDSDDISVSERVTVQLLALLKNKVMVTMSMILRSHLPDFSTINTFDKSSVLSACEERRIHKNLIATQDSSKSLDNFEYKYCCKAILGMVTTFFNREIFYDLDLYWTLPCIADAEFCERLLFKYTGKLFKEDENVVTFLSENAYIPNLFYKIPEILYISEEMRQKNITSQLRQFAQATRQGVTDQTDKEEIKNGLIRGWRLKLIGQHEYIYPRLD